MGKARGLYGQDTSGGKRCGSAAAASDDPVVLAVMTDPKPDDVGAVLDRRGAIVNADPHRPHPAHFLKMEGWVPRVGLEQFVVFIRKPPDLLGELRMKVPELRVGAVPHNSRQRPSRRSRTASSARASKRPAATSSSNCLSHAAASNSENQSRKDKSSWRESLLTAVSISWTVLMPGE